MSGFKNDVIYAKNGDFSSTNNLSPSESNGLATNGQIWTGTTAVNAGGTHVNVGQMVSPDSSITFGYTSPNITATVNTSVIRDLHTAQYIVSPSGQVAGANYTTIQSAIDAAFTAGGGVVAIHEATYTENLTLRPGVNLAAFGGGGLTPKVTIVGKATYTSAGTVTISDIRLQTNADNFLAVTGSASSIVYLNNCFLNMTNATGITFSSSQATSQIYINNCFGDLGITGIALHAHTSAGNIWYNYTYITNTGSSTTASDNSAGNVFIQYSNLNTVFTTSSTGSVTFSYSIIGFGNTTGLTTAGTGTSAIEASRVSGGTASAISIGAGTIVEIKGYVDAISSNTNAITGAGQVKFNQIYYYLDSAINVTTQSAYVTQFGIQKSSLQPAFSAYLNATGTNLTGDGTFVYLGDSSVSIGLTEIYDQNSNFIPSQAGGAVFTAPFSGIYNLNMTFQITSLTALFTAMSATIVTSNRSYRAIEQFPGVVRDTNNNLALSFSADADMDAGDTATFEIRVLGSTKTVGLRAASGGVQFCYVSGKLIC